MNALPKTKRAARVAPDTARDHYTLTDNRSTPRPYAVITNGTKRREWGRYGSVDETGVAAAKLRSFGWQATVEGPDS